MKRLTSNFSMKLGAVAGVALLMAACTDGEQQRQTTQTTQNTWNDVQNRTEQLYNDTRTELRQARDRGRICLSEYENLRNEWRDHTGNMDTNRADESWRVQMREWREELDDMFDDMGDHIDRNC